ncbi:murein biosynthesis integral membrane protein MurJ [Alginatibacterium sediminis]|uniref:Probable lipid II flippase MurJ n=1 Tax=Alginatibacterium sediminis TaxID=2164068 RepID=A0A420EJP6_9ALTE|nr:murein biosynthesis integral membrane protein MurJ [Alginatibacterium sediminis]RKF20942.1 murein biosynthesis integral membrane protein MurJ [Alginatibacterium sediminis]
MSKNLLRSGAIVSAMTFISRILGLVRDVVVANLMGAGVAADVFFFANKIPNFLRRLFAEGAFAQAFVPVLTEYKQQQDQEEVRQLVAKVAGTLGLVVTVVTLIGVVASPVIAGLFGTGWFKAWLAGEPDGEKFVLASSLLKITFPYLWFITFTGLSGAILNAYNRFAVAAFTPVFLNVAIISCAIYLGPQLDQPEYALAWGVFLGGLIQFCFQLPFMARLGFLRRPSWGWNHSGVKRIRTLMIPALFGVSVAQINLLFDTFIASFLMTGSISWLYYSDRLLEFPLGLFGIAIATVILPNLSQKHVAKSREGFSLTMEWGVKMVCVLGLPAAVGLMVLSEPMLQVLFMRGEFGADDVLRSAASLKAYSLGLLFFMLIKVLAPGYYSRQDTKTPVRIGIIAMACNMLFNIILVFKFAYVGLALATSLSALLNAALLYRGLHQQQVFRLQRSGLVFIAKVIFSALLMGVLIHYFAPSREQWLAYSWWQSAATLGFAIAAAALSYLVCLLGLGIRPRHLRTNAAT